MIDSRDDNVMSNLLNENSGMEWNTSNMADFSSASARVLSIRYKVYVLFILLMVYVFIQYLFFPALDNYQNKSLQLQNRIAEINNFESERLRLLSDVLFIDKLDEQESLIIDCFNREVACDNIDDVIKNNFNLSRTYLNINNISDDVMIVDEKSILANINDFLMMWWAVWNRSRNGVIQRIVISDPQLYRNNIYSVDIDLNISFDNKEGLLSFLDNVENKVSENPNLRQLYLINKVDYNVVMFDQEQDSQISLTLFYYVD